MSIAENLLHLKKTLPSEVTLVAVSKTKPNEAVMEAYEAGQRDFGENYVQELVDKHELLPKDIRWHFIGHLQSNKVKYIAPFVHLIHGIDSLKLLQEVNKQGEKIKRIINCLLQIYIAKEQSKFGFDAAEAQDLLIEDVVQTLPYVKISGLMGMASNTEQLGQVKAEFESLTALFRQFKDRPVAGTEMRYLSCGMSGDYKLAIEAGSTMLRIGSSIFGERMNLR